MFHPLISWLSTPRTKPLIWMVWAGTGWIMTSQGSIPPDQAV
ncbi:hypothetical protein NC651_022709 [Populus alba x Populus x berolinensis]|nr:hypothetical protein NC651_022709 [Populus alba x Populus x berolinensis]